MNLKNLMLAGIAFMFATTAFAQPQSNDLRRGGMMMQRTIQVTGNSEMEVVPDVVYLDVQLHQYPEQGKDTTMVSMETIENDFYKRLGELGISKDAVSVCDAKEMPMGDSRNHFGHGGQRPEMQGDAMQFAQGRKGPDRVKCDSMPCQAGGEKMCRIDRKAPVMQNKHYEIVLNDYSLVEKVKKALDERAVAGVRVTEIASDKLDEYYEKMRVEALSDATTVAKALVESAGGKLGNVVSIVVQPENKGKADKGKGVIKLRSSVTVTFMMQ